MNLLFVIGENYLIYCQLDLIYRAYMAYNQKVVIATMDGMISLVKEVDLFKDMSRIEIDALLKNAKGKYYLENDVILSEGMMQKCLYIVM